MSENKSQTPAQNTPENSEKKKVSLFALIVVLVVAVIVMVALFVRSNNLSSQLDEVNGQLAVSNTELQQTIADKETAQADDFRYTGHTEYLAAELEGSPMMLMCSDRLRVGLVTTHLPLAEVSAAISRAKITEALDRLARSLVADFGVVKPRIAVLALNPHAGDGGLLGREEEETIRPAVNDAYAAGVLAFGPFAADGFFASGNYAHYDAVLAMYHDQGLAPFKTLTPDGVNYTAGLCEVRTSPDHGVAYDIAGRDKADPQSMRNAIYAALDIVENRRRWAAMSVDPLQHFERDRGRDQRPARNAGGTPRLTVSCTGIWHDATTDSSRPGARWPGCSSACGPWYWSWPPPAMPSTATWS